MTADAFALAVLAPVVGAVALGLVSSWLVALFRDVAR